MSKHIKWKNGQVIDDEILTENDRIHYSNTFNSISNLQNYYYGIGSINIREVNMVHGILSIESCCVTFMDGNTVKSINNVNEFKFNRVFQGQEMPLFLKYISNENNSKYVEDEIIIDDQGDIYLGKIQNINGLFQLSLDGCYLKLQSHNLFMQFLSKAISELNNIYKYYQNDLINIESNEYFMKLIHSKNLKSLINVLNSLQDNITHPFDAYNLLCPYSFKYMKYDHNNNIRCIKNMIDDVMQCYKILEESNIVEMDDDYYYLNMQNKSEIKMVINPRDDLVISWIENTYICSKELMKSLQTKRYKGLKRETGRYGQYLLVTIHRDEDYIGESNIVCIKRDATINILNLKILD